MVLAAVVYFNFSLSLSLTHTHIQNFVGRAQIFLDVEI